MKTACSCILLLMWAGETAAVLLPAGVTRAGLLAAGAGALLLAALLFLKTGKQYRPARGLAMAAGTAGLVRAVLLLLQTLEMQTPDPAGILRNLGESLKVLFTDRDLRVLLILAALFALTFAAPVLIRPVWGRLPFRYLRTAALFTLLFYVFAGAVQPALLLLLSAVPFFLLDLADFHECGRLERTGVIWHALQWGAVFLADLLPDGSFQTLSFTAERVEAALRSTASWPCLLTAAAGLGALGLCAWYFGRGDGDSRRTVFAAVTGLTWTAAAAALRLFWSGWLYGTVAALTVCTAASICVFCPGPDDREEIRPAAGSPAGLLVQGFLAAAVLIFSASARLGHPLAAAAVILGLGFLTALAVFRDSFTGKELEKRICLTVLVTGAAAALCRLWENWRSLPMAAAVLVLLAVFTGILFLFWYEPPFFFPAGRGQTAVIAAAFLVLCGTVMLKGSRDITITESREYPGMVEVEVETGEPGLSGQAAWCSGLLDLFKGESGLSAAVAEGVSQVPLQRGLLTVTLTEPDGTVRRESRWFRPLEENLS